MHKVGNVGNFCTSSNGNNLVLVIVEYVLLQIYIWLAILNQNMCIVSSLIFKIKQYKKANVTNLVYYKKTLTCKWVS